MRIAVQTRDATQTLGLPLERGPARIEIVKQSRRPFVFFSSVLLAGGLLPGRVADGLKCRKTIRERSLSGPQRIRITCAAANWITSRTAPFSDLPTVNVDHASALGSNTDRLN